MSKSSLQYACNSCNYISVKWLGCCPECKEWQTFTEIKSSAIKQIGKTNFAAATPTQLTHLSHISTQSYPRLLSGIAEWDRVVGGGIMPHSLMILTGDPGIGKSTLLLQICNKIAENHTVFFFSTEESIHQVKQRADRLSCNASHLFFSDNADLSAIIATTQQEKPTLVVIDSIQNCYIPGAQSLPGSVGQLREATFQLMRLAKEYNCTIIITGHITKEGMIAGPKTLEHMVDAVIYLQGEDRWHTRILRAVKNRFGTINELGFFEMHEHGLAQMANINAHLLDEMSHQPGSALISIIEGSRPLLLELQALIIQSKLSMPQRVISGLDPKQVMLIAAILEKYLKIKLSTHDIFFKVGGGFKIKGSSVDMGIALALLSSYFQQSIPEKTLILGELSLTGQIKPINQINLFVGEAEKFHLDHLYVAKNQKIEKTTCAITRFSHVYELLSLFKLD
jgi:DNA repair protein RadA/Sms